jgi:Outer membrane protein beta-barrel domain
MKVKSILVGIVLVKFVIIKYKSFMKNKYQLKQFYKCFIVITLLTTNVATLLAQDKESMFRFGAKGGVNINKIDGKSFSSAFNYNFQAGVFAQFNITKKIGIQPEVSFVQTQSEYTDDANIIYEDLVGGGKQHTAKLDYLEIPIFLNINIGPTQKVKLQIGPAYGGLLKQTTDSLKTGINNVYKNGEWSAIGGLWLQLPLINISARYKMGLTDVSALNSLNEWKNQAIQISIGITL